MNVDECINKLQSEISKKEKQILLLQNLNLSEKVDGNKWHELCKTPFRHSDDLGKLVLNIFPEAKDINVGCNYVYFLLYGFKVQIPTSLCRGINIDTNWYYNESKPIMRLSYDEKMMRQYFKCVDENKGWYECARHRLGTQWRTWYLWLLWWRKYKWKNDNREEWELRFKQIEDNYQERLELYYQSRKEMDNKVCLFVEKLLPEIGKFSKEHYAYDGDSCNSMKEIIEVYNKIVDKNNKE